MRLSLRRQSSLSEPNQDLIAALGGEQVIAGERVSPESAMRIADVFNAISFIVETIATLPLNVYRRLPDGVENANDTYRNSRMLGVAPNPVQPAHRFWATVAAHLLGWGNSFVEKLRDENGLVSELWLFHPSQVEVQWNSELRQKRFVIGGDYQNPLTDDRVLHIVGFTHDGLVGLSPIQQCRQQLGLVKARERFEGEVYANKPFMSGVIEHPKTLNRGSVSLRESWRSIYGGGDKGVKAQSERHTVGVLEEGAHFNQLTAPLEDMQFIEATQMSRTHVANMYHMPVSYLNGSSGDSLRYETVEANSIQFARNAITPVTVNIQKCVGADRGIFPFASWYPEFALDALLRGDSSARAAFYTALSGVKAITVNEIRMLENMPPIAGGDKSPAETQPVPAALADFANTNGRGGAGG